MGNSKFNIRNHVKGSYIILENETKNDFFYIIQSGSVKITQELPILGQSKEEVISKGDFFGVIGCMAQLPHYETAFCITNVILISVSFSGFSELIQTNSALALKIVRSYSKKLRLLTNRSSGAQHQLDDLNSLLKYADYYESTEYQNIAIYMYKSYLYHSNNSELNESIANKLNDLGSTESYTPSADFLSTYKEGEVIFCEGEPGSTLHIVQSGSIRISKLVDNKDTQLYVMKKGDIFGEMAILEKKFRSASAIAIENTSLLNINKSNFEIMVGQNPQLISKIIMLLSERIWYTSRIVRNSMIKDINNRIIDLLYSLVLKNRITISNNIQYNFNINFPELLSMMDIKDNYNSTINKFLNQNNNIKLESDCIICNDLYYLERQATAQKVK